MISNEKCLDKFATLTPWNIHARFSTTRDSYHISTLISFTNYISCSSLFIFCFERQSPCVLLQDFGRELGSDVLLVYHQDYGNDNRQDSD